MLFPEITGDLIKYMGNSPQQNDLKSNLWIFKDEDDTEKKKN